MDKQGTYCGLLIYRTQRHTEFLLLNDTFSHKKHWTAPKGKVIGSEDEVKCALRETCEITGLSPKDLRVEEGFKAEIKYLSDTRPKKVIYFLAHLADNVRIIPTGEGINFQWWQLPAATEKAFYGSMQGVLRQAVLFIESDSHKLQLRGIPRLEKSFTAPAGLGGGHTNDGLESRFRNMNIALPLESQRQAMSRQRAEQHREQRNVRLERSFTNELGKNGDKSSSQTSMPFENPLYKTRLCERFETEGYCPYNTKCTFAHSITELRDRSKPTVETQSDNPLYKTRLCERFMKDNFCQYGPRCNFAHGLQELRERPKTKDGAENEEPGNDYTEPSYRVRGERDDAGQAQHQSRTEKHEVRDKHDAAHGKPAIPLPAAKHEPPSEFLEMMIALQEQPMVAPAPVVPATPPHSKDINGSAKAIVPAGARGKGGAHVPLKKQFSSNDEISNEKAWMKVVELSKDDQERLQTHKPQSPAPSLGKPLVEESIIRDLKKFVAQSPSDIIKEVTRVEMRNDLSKTQLFNAVIPTLLDEFGVDSTAHAVVGAIKSHEKLFKTLIRSRQDQLTFLSAWEKYVLHRNPGLLGKSPVVFKYLYDSDLAEEDMFVKWYQAADDMSEVKKKTGVFIKWLENAEEED